MAETAKSLIARSWRKTRARKPKRGIVAIYAGHSILLSSKTTSVAFQNHLEPYDEFISWLSDVAVVLLTAKGILKREDYAYAYLASAVTCLLRNENTGVATAVALRTSTPQFVAPSLTFRDQERGYSWILLRVCQMYLCFSSDLS